MGNLCPAQLGVNVEIAETPTQIFMLIGVERLLRKDQDHPVVKGSAEFFVLFIREGGGEVEAPDFRPDMRRQALQLEARVLALK